jgi:Double zinc ribbon
MTCARCRQDNRADARFCEHCGASLHLACTACDAELSPSARFCPECGRPTGWGLSPTETAARSPQAYTPAHLAARILMSRAAMEGERNQVTASSPIHWHGGRAAFSERARHRAPPARRAPYRTMTPDGVTIVWV